METLDYKIVEEKEVNGEIVYQKVRYYLGDITIENEPDPDTGRMTPMEKYRRTTLNEEVEYTYG